jgi:hypothetical protein
MGVATPYRSACSKKRAHSSKSPARRIESSTRPPALSHSERRQNVDYCWIQ